MPKDQKPSLQVDEARPESELSDLEKIIAKLTTMETSIFTSVQAQLDEFKKDIRETLDFHLKDMHKNLKNYYDYIKGIVDEHRSTLKRHESLLNDHAGKLIVQGNDIREVQKSILELREELGSGISWWKRYRVLVVVGLLILYMGINLWIVWKTRR